MVSYLSEMSNIKKLKKKSLKENGRHQVRIAPVTDASTGVGDVADILTGSQQLSHVRSECFEVNTLEFLGILHKSLKRTIIQAFKHAYEVVKKGE